jgi:predicted transcriptional regulator
MSKEILSLLSQIGLKKADISVFICLLGFPDGLHIVEICKETKIKRSTVYLALNRLIENGYIRTVKVGARWKYFPEPIETLISSQEKILSGLKDVAPFLEKLRGTQNSFDVKFFEGVEGVRKTYDDILIQLKFAKGDKKSLLAFSTGDDLIKIYPLIEKEFINKRVKMNVPYKSISPLSTAKVKEWQPNQASLRDIKFIEDEKLPFRITIEIYADSVRIFSATRPIGGVIIKNALMAESFRALHKFMWDIL